LQALVAKGLATTDAMWPAIRTAYGWVHRAAHLLANDDGLFHCYDVPGLPRTNNGLEQYFGSARYHQRRASGRVHATAATVVRGSVRVIAATASRLRLFGEYDLRHPNLDRWTDLRHSLEVRHEARRQQGRFRQNPTAYLATLEATLLKPSLPS
jgi:hypothetical protein